MTFYEFQHCNLHSCLHKLVTFRFSEALREDCLQLRKSNSSTQALVLHTMYVGVSKTVLMFYLGLASPKFIFSRIPMVCILLLLDLCTNTLAIPVQISNLFFLTGCGFNSGLSLLLEWILQLLLGKRGCGSHDNSAALSAAPCLWQIKCVGPLRISVWSSTSFLNPPYNFLC